jgi:acyl carrier protein|tara:strand:- start:202 stop:441 length:240 start_codon:yes stop_codon:yes gene_type:complete
MEKIIKEKLHNILKEVFEIKEIADDVSMNTVSGWDSLRHIQLISKIEEEFGVEIDFKDTLKMTSLESITNILEKYVGEK